MDERKFLDKIRKMKESGQSIRLTEMSDIELKKDDKKKLLESYLKPGLIIEDFNQDFNQEKYEREEDESGQNISPDEQREEENAFKDKVSQLVEFKKIKVFTKTVTWSGKLVREGIDWSYTLDDKIGCFINTDEGDTLQLTDDMLEVIKNIRAYYDIWSEEWGSRLVGSPRTDDDEENF